LIWALLRSAVVLAVALRLVVLFGFLLVAHAEPRFWLFLPLEAGGYAALATAVLALLTLADVIVEVVALAKAYLAAGAVAGVLAGVLLAVAVVVTAVLEAVPEIAREVGVPVEEAPLQRGVVWGGGGGWLRHVYFVASRGASLAAS